MSNGDVVEKRECRNCGVSFPIFARDKNFYARVEVPFPTWCPDCRRLRRHGHVNDYVYYSRTCDQCAKRFVSTFPAESPYRVICQQCWYAEERDDKAEGRVYEPSRTFFEQFDELMRSAPQMGILAINTENSDYCESIADCKNCYLISECSNCEDSLYAYWIQRTRDCVDNCYLHECERCYEISDSFNCYALRYSSNCRNCSDSFFLEDCIGCHHCAFSTNLRHKEYHLFNEPLSKDDYFAALKKLGLGDRSRIQEHSARFDAFLRSQPKKHLQMEQCENSIGDYVRNAKNCYMVWHCYDAEDCAYGEHVWRGAKDCCDVQTAGRDAELLYETTNTNMGAYFTKFARYCWGCRYVEYSNMCVNSSYLFGCVSLKAGAKYCILNKQYSEAEYFAIVAKIKENMMRAKEYGEFFPLSISLFGYNNSVSFDELQLRRDDVLKKGWKWEESPSGVSGKGTIAMDGIPTAIEKVEDTICNEVLTCANCEKNYRIIRPELTFYRAEGVPVPAHCPDCRHRARLARRNKKKMRLAKCHDCGSTIVTTLSTALFQRIVCENCYEKSVYSASP